MSDNPLILRARGLATAPNELAGDVGVLTRADDCVIDFDGVIQPRRGLPKESTDLAASNPASNIISHDSGLIAITGTASHNTAWDYNTGSGWHSVTVGVEDVSVDAPASPYGLPIHSSRASENTYYTGANGILKQESITSSPRPAGIPKGLDVKASLSGSSGILDGNSQVAYRMLWGYRDSNGNVLLGPPSQRAILYIPRATSASGQTARAANVVTVHTDSAHSFVVGQQVSLQSPSGDANFPAGTFTIATVADNTHFTYAETAANATSAAGFTYVAVSSGVSVSNEVPDRVNLTSFFQLYRTAGSASDSTDPGDEMSLVYEGAPSTVTITQLVRSGSTVTATTSGAHGLSTNDAIMIIASGAKNANFVKGRKIVASTPSGTTFTYTETGSAVTGTNGWVGYKTPFTVSDIVPDELRGAALYTNGTQEGILQANEPPPAAWDIAYFKGCQWYLNTTSRARVTLSIITVGTGGLVSGDTITIDGTVFTAGSSETLSSNTFKVYTTLTASLNAYYTAQSLCHVINASSASVYAFITAGQFDLPSTITLEARDIAYGEDSFIVNVSGHGNAYSPSLPTSASTDFWVNGLYYSKPGQPEAVPILNYFRVGPANKTAWRLIPLRDSMIVLSTAGVYRVTGEDPSTFRVDPLDLNVEILATESAVALGNKVYCLTTQGVAEISDTGVEIISGPIKDLLDPVLGKPSGSNAGAAFGVAVELDHRYLLWFPNSSGSLTQAYVYNAAKGIWTRWVMTATCGVVDRAVGNQIVLGVSGDNSVRRENKAFSYADYYDAIQILTPTGGASGGGTVLHFSGVAIEQAGIDVGWIVVQGNLRSTVTDTDSGDGEVLVADGLAWTTGVVWFFAPTDGVNAVVEWRRQVGGSPGLVKQTSNVNFLFRRADFATGSAKFYSEVSQSLETVSVDGSGFSNWTFSPWGSDTYSGMYSPKIVRLTVPQAKQRCAELSVRFSISAPLAFFMLEGVSLGAAELSDRTNR